MTGDDPRFLRQVILAEVGPAGQRRLARATASLSGDGLAHEVAATYAVRAGFASVLPGPIAAPAPAEIVSTPAAAAVLAGSRAALAAILAAAKGAA